jgi:NAD+ diphosphatase
VRRFEFDQPPMLSRAEYDRADEIRDDHERLKNGWSRALLLQIDPTGRYPVGEDGLGWIMAVDVDDAPPPEAVFLGLHPEEGHDMWAMRFDVIDGPKDDPRRGAQLLGPNEAGILSTALGVLNWHDTARFSPVDGAHTEAIKGGWVRRNVISGREEFPRTDPAIITVVHDGGDRILLGRQKQWPDRWFSTLAGFVEPGESLEQCVLREVHEEVGVDAWNPQYIGSQPWPFPRSLMVGFEVTADPDQPLDFIDGEIAAAEWFGRAEVIEAIEAQQDWMGPDGNPIVDNARLRLPGSISIASALIRAWAYTPATGVR